MQPDATGFEAAGVLAGSWPGGHGRCGDDPQQICVRASVTRARAERISEVVGRADLLHRAARRDLHDHGKRAEELQRLLTGSAVLAPRGLTVRHWKVALPRPYPG